MSLYVGLDPSFKAFGIAMIDTDSKRLELYQREVPMNKRSTIQKLNAIESMSMMVRNIIESKSAENIYIGQELSTAYTGWMVAELFGLAQGLRHQLLKLYPFEYDFYSQSYLQFIHKQTHLNKKVKYSKESTIFLAMNIISIFESYGYLVSAEKLTETSTGEKDPNYKNRYIKVETITDGEADALMYAIRSYIKINRDSKLAQAILAKYPVFDVPDKELK